MRLKSILLGAGAVSLVGLVAVGIICGVRFNGKIGISFEDLTVEAKYKEYSVTWLDSDGQELEKDEKLSSGSKAFYNSVLPTKEGYVFIGFDNAEQTSTGAYYTTVDTSNITCVAQYQAIEAPSA